jgi:hypothetical protein
LSLESLIQLPLKLFGLHPRYAWERTTNDVVSVTQMQSSGERGDRTPTSMAQPCDEIFTLI